MPFQANPPAPVHQQQTTVKQDSSGANSPNVVTGDNSVVIVGSPRVRYSSTQVLEIANAPGDYAQKINLDGTETLSLGASFDLNTVTLTWSDSPTLSIAHPKPEVPYTFPGDSDMSVVFGSDIEFNGVVIRIYPVNMDFNTTTQRTKLVRVGDRVFRLTLKDIKDKSDATHAMFLAYTFLITEEEASFRNRRTAVSIDDYGFKPLVEEFRAQPRGTLTMRLHESLNGRPNAILVRGGEKELLIDSEHRVVHFKMRIESGRQVDLELNLGTDSKAAHYVGMSWDEAKGAYLFVDGQLKRDGLE